ncbi:MAG TPA: PDZ domain-containing protein [Pirellulales bacterium]|nr:PDZ domain-containing protein [Pirellulales bacterium]
MRGSLLAVVIWLLPASPTLAQEVDRSLVLEEFDIQTDGDMLLVPVRIGDKDCTFAVATGCTDTLVDASLKHLLGAPVGTASAKTPNGTVDVPVFEFPSMYWGRIPVTVRGRVGCLPLDSIRKQLGHPVDGFLGMDVLSNFVMHLDFDNGKLSLLQKPIREGTVVSFADQQKPTVPIQFPGLEPIQCSIDTGKYSGNTGSILPKTFSRLGNNGSLVESGKLHLIWEASGTAEVRHGLVNKFTIGDDFSFVDTAWDEHKHGREGFVGLYFLTQFNVTFDFPHCVIYLKKNKNFGHRDAVVCCGLHAYRIDGQVVVQSVDEDGPAEKCGLRANDIIKAVDGKDADQARMFELFKAFWYPREHIPLVIERDSKTIEMELTLPEPPRFVLSRIRID